MSGWRSGAGRRGDLLDDVMADPASVLGSTPRQRTGARAFFVILAVAIAAIGALSWYQASLRPPHRSLPPPVNARVLIVPIGDLPDGLLANVTADYRAEYGLIVDIAARIPIDPSTFAPGDQSIAASPVLAALAAAYPAGPGAPIVIGVSRADLGLTGAQADGEMAARLGDRIALISTYRLPSMKTISRTTLFRRTLTRELGFLVWQLPPTDNEYDLLFRGVVNEIDLERVSDHL